MDTTSSQIELVTMSEVLELASWDRPRSNEELRSFISSREAIVANQ
ncbi:hypothetical protein H7200_01265 [Candidatus Saccharibacteria bacterium]|nr:hypothetical protein [Candidatus Saccharibacteria bacterium]